MTSQVWRRFTVENSVYIDATVRGSGVGRALLETLIVECERRGYRQTVAVIGDSANGNCNTRFSP